MRWAVKINNINGEDILADVLADVGFDLSGDMLSGEPFEALENWHDVSDAGHELARKIQVIARLDPEFKVNFSTGAVHEYDDGGKEIHVHAKLYVDDVVMTTHAGVVEVCTVPSSLSLEEKIEMNRKARVTKTADLLRATIHSDLVLTIMDLLYREPGALELGNVYEFILNDMKGDLSPLATRTQLKRFTRSINHPDVLGARARHAITNDTPPPDPMNLEEATQFINDVVNKWIKAKSDAALTELRP